MPDHRNYNDPFKCAASKFGPQQPQVFNTHGALLLRATEYFDLTGDNVYKVKTKSSWHVKTLAYRYVLGDQVGFEYLQLTVE